jgi:hypothetical protein
LFEPKPRVHELARLLQIIFVDQRHGLERDRRRAGFRLRSIDVSLPRRVVVP